LALLPASAWAVSFSNLNITPTEFSVDISGNLPDNGLPYLRTHLIITNPTLNTSPGFVLGEDVSADTASFSGSQTVNYFRAGDQPIGDHLFVVFNSALSETEGLNGTLSGTWSSAVFDPAEVSSVNFYWGTNEVESPTGGIALGSASLSAVPDTGSTAALLGAGVMALAFARRRLG
tara:strand:+ start:96 stop:623 length:528 start_codon:yes stop_codon:yes gene_type:complete